MDRQQRIDFYINKLSEKGFEIYHVRRELEAQNVDEQEIKAIVRAVDEELQKRLVLNAEKDHAASFTRYGIVLTAIGGVLLALSATKIIYFGENIYIGYVPFFIGLGMIVVGLLRKRKTDNDDEDDTDANRKISFRRNRR